MRRFIVELGMGSDLHGGDVTKAAMRAVRDAVSRSCLCGLFEVAGLKRPEDMFIHLKVCCPTPERLDRERVAGSVPFGKVDLEVREGGMTAEGIQLPQLGEGSSIVVALVSLTVCVE